MTRKLKEMLTRAERHLIRPSSPWFSMLSDFCYLAKNLYNHANYLVRSRFIENGQWMRYEELDKVLKNDAEYPDYKAMPTAQSAQQVLRLLDQNWKSFFASIRDWNENKEKYYARPNLPKYKKKDGRFVLVLTNQNCRLQGNEIVFPKVFKGFKVSPEFLRCQCNRGQRNFKSFQQVRFIPDIAGIVMEIVYTIEATVQLENNGKCAGIDIGVNNLVAMATNTATAPLLINGRILKSINQFYNKEVSRQKSICKHMTGRYSSRRIRQLTAKRNRRIADYLHKASRLIVDVCLEQGVTSIVIGRNKDWKQGSKFDKRGNQHFVQLPFLRLIQMIEYKAKEAGITVFLVEESYTSGTSFLDGEAPLKANYDKSRRICRGLFRADNGRLINADVNSAFQMMKKVFPNVFADGIEGVVLRPVAVVAA